MQPVDRHSDEVVHLDSKLDELKKKVAEVELRAKGSKKEVKVLEKLQAEYRHLVNLRRERVLAARQRNKIKIEGAPEEAVPYPVESFAAMQKLYGFSDVFMRRLKENDISAPTAVQVQGVPLVYAKKSAIILAETGSGKSLAFVAPLLHMYKHGDGLKAIVLAPTRELTI